MIQQAPPTFPQDQSDIPMECSSENSPANELSCNISTPFMKTSSQVGAASTQAMRVPLKEEITEKRG